jgi:hypothetical protein
LAARRHDDAADHAISVPLILLNFPILKNASGAAPANVVFSNVLRDENSIFSAAEATTLEDLHGRHLRHLPTQSLLTHTSLQAFPPFSSFYFFCLNS